QSGQSNFYQYVANNSVNLTDPSGLEGLWDYGKGLAKGAWTVYQGINPAIPIGKAVGTSLRTGDWSKTGETVLNEAVVKPVLTVHPSIGLGTAVGEAIEKRDARIALQPVLQMLRSIYPTAFIGWSTGEAINTGEWGKAGETHG